MADANETQLYLITPADAGLNFYTESFAPLLDQFPVACVRLGLQSDDADDIRRHADQLREVAHARDISALITDHYRFVTDIGMDGVHRTDGAKHLRDVRKEIGDDAIIGSYCGTSKHDGLTAGEITADYVAVGPMQSSPLDDGQAADSELFQWWSLMVELPVVAEGRLTPDLVESLAPTSDFIALGSELWSHPQPPAELLASYYERFK